MGDTEQKAAWFDFRISVSTLLTIGAAAVAIITSYNRLEAQVDVVQRLLVEQGNQIETLRRESERQDVASAERRALLERMQRLEKTVDQLK